MEKQFSLKTETVRKEERLYQPELFNQWYEQYIIQENDDDVRPPAKPKPIKAWWLKNQYA